MAGRPIGGDRLDRRDVRTLELRTGYRVPQTIADFATRFLAPGIPATHSYRGGGDLSVRPVDDLDDAVCRAVAEAPRDGSTAVITADSMIGHLSPLIDRPDVSLVPASLVKGLEYDHVIVVEPSEITDAEPRGYSRLYVVLTRAVGSLVVLHRRPLPAFLRE